MFFNIRASFMQLLAIVFGLYAVLLGLAPFAAINLPARLILDISDWPLDSLSTQLDKDVMWLSAIVAGLLAAVAIIFWGIVAPAIRKGDRSVIRTTIWAMVVWYIIDGAGSIVAGVGSNVIFNTVYLILILTPLIGVSKKP